MIKFLSPFIVVVYLLTIMSCNQSNPGNTTQVPVDSTNLQSDTLAQLIPGEYNITFTKQARTGYRLLFKGDLTKDDELSGKFYHQKFIEIYGKKFKSTDSILFGSAFGFLFKGDTSALAQLRADPTIGSIQQNMIRTLDVGEATSPIDRAQLLPWGVKRVSISSKPDGVYKKAWIVDTGLDLAQPDLNVKESRSFVSGEDNKDYHGHGTHVAGIIGAKANTIGVVGVAPNAPIYAVKAFSVNMKTNIGREYLPALTYVANNAKAGEVVNLSLSGEGEDKKETELIRDMANNGVRVVIAAGNDTKDVAAGKGIYPANLNGTNIFTVAGFKDGDIWSPKSNYGTSIDFMGPGYDIESLVPGSSSITMLTGTSQAAPHISGLLLLKSTVKPDKKIKAPDGRLIPIGVE